MAAPPQKIYLGYIFIAAHGGFNMSNEELCTEGEIVTLVHAFYDRVRADSQLGPIFDARISDWGPHLERMVDFWSSVLLQSGRFRGSPMQKHAAIPGLSAELFGRWVALFGEVCSDQANQRMAAAAAEAAARMARSLWIGYQLSGSSGLPITTPAD